MRAILPSFVIPTNWYSETYCRDNSSKPLKARLWFNHSLTMMGIQVCILVHVRTHRGNSLWPQDRSGGPFPPSHSASSILHFLMDPTSYHHFNCFLLPVLQLHCWRWACVMEAELSTMSVNLGNGTNVGGHSWQAFCPGAGPKCQTTVLDMDISHVGRTASSVAS